MFDKLAYFTEYGQKQIKNTEEMLRLGNVFSEDETIYDFLKRPSFEVVSLLNKFCEQQKEHHKPIPGVRHDSVLFHVLSLIAVSDSLFAICKSKENDSPVVVANAEMAWREINSVIIKEINPYLLVVFKWDFERRNWKHEKDKLFYIRKTIEDIGNELKGLKENIASKYISLFLSYIFDYYEKGLFRSTEEDFKLLKMNRDDAFNTRNQIRDLMANNKISDFIDEGMETSMLAMYKPMAQGIVEGIYASTNNRYDYLVAAFVEAQNDYRKNLEGIIEALSTTSINDIMSALQNEDVEKFINILHSIFATVPYHLLRNTSEAHYHMNVHLILQAIGCNIISEASVNNGRIDSVVEFEKVIYIIEYKITDSMAALEQIKQRKYYDAYKRKNKKIWLVGISFDIKERNINKTFESEVVL